MHGSDEGQRTQCEEKAGHHHKHPARSVAEGRQSGVVLAHNRVVAIHENHQRGDGVHYRAYGEPPESEGEGIRGNHLSIESSALCLINLRIFSHNRNFSKGRIKYSREANKENYASFEV